jgi:DNA-binding response OmpR family regulator
MRIVRVDQSRTIVRIVSELVQADGHEVLGFTDGRKALACLGSDADIRALIASVLLESLSGARYRSLQGRERPPRS